MNTDTVNFDINAEQYSKWEVTSNDSYLNKFYEFADIEKNDRVIDIACGSGDFLIACSEKIGKSKGIDISKKLIEIAHISSKNKHVNNLSFEVKNIEQEENIKGESYDAIVCRMAMHHFEHTDLAFEKSLTYAAQECKVAMQDIVAHDVEIVDRYFDKLEKYIDQTHKSIISKDDFEYLFRKNEIDIEKAVVLEREIILDKYIQHAKQSPEQIQKLDKHIIEGMSNPIIRKYIYKKDNITVFKRKILLIKGRLRRNDV